VVVQHPVQGATIGMGDGFGGQQDLLQQARDVTLTRKRGMKMNSSMGSLRRM
jgi:hypothetical protein